MRLKVTFVQFNIAAPRFGTLWELRVNGASLTGSQRPSDQVFRWISSFGQSARGRGQWYVRHENTVRAIAFAEKIRALGPSAITLGGPRLSQAARNATVLRSPRDGSQLGLGEPAGAQVTPFGDFSPDEDSALLNCSADLSPDENFAEAVSHSEAGLRIERSVKRDRVGKVAGWGSPLRDLLRRESLDFSDE